MDQNTFDLENLVVSLSTSTARSNAGSTINAINATISSNANQNVSGSGKAATVLQNSTHSVSATLVSAASQYLSVDADSSAALSAVSVKSPLVAAGAGGVFSNSANGSYSISNRVSGVKVVTVPNSVSSS